MSIGAGRRCYRRRRSACSWQYPLQRKLAPKAVRFVNDVVGTSSIRIGQPFERHFRDTHTLLQHSDKSSPRYASAGRLMFGLENDWVWLNF